MRGSIRSLAFATAGVIALATAGSASAASLLNGDFATNNGNGQINYNPGSGAYTVADWTVAGDASHSYDFVFNPQASTTSGTSADNSGAIGESGNGPSNPLKLWGPGTSSSNGLNVTALTAAGGNGTFIAVDPNYQNTANGISQTVTGLTSGQSYTVTFEYAGAEQTTGSGAQAAGPTTEGWGSLGAQAAAL